MTSQATRQANLLSDCLNSLKMWRDLIDTYLDGDEKSTEKQHFEDVVKDFCRIDFEASKASEACEEVIEYFGDDANNQDIDVDKLYQDKLAGNSTVFNYQQHKIWKEVVLGAPTDCDVEEVNQAETNTAEEADYEEMHDSIFCSNVFTPPVDPISKTVIKDPYKNKTCGHIYEYKFILQYIKSMKNKANCPYIGCNNRNITVSELVKDTETKDKILNYQKTNNNSQSSSNE